MLELFSMLLGKVLPDVVKRVLPPEKMSQEDSAKLQQELALTLMAQDWKSIEAEYSDRASARWLAAQEVAKSPPWAAAASAIVHPVWGLGAFALVVYSLLNNMDIKPALQSIIETVIMFYFGGRVVEKVTPHVAGIFEGGKK